VGDNRGVTLGSRLNHLPQKQLRVDKCIHGTVHDPTGKKYVVWSSIEFLKNGSVNKNSLALISNKRGVTYHTKIDLRSTVRTPYGKMRNDGKITFCKSCHKMYKLDSFETLLRSVL